MQLIAEGMTSSEIASKLFLSVYTVDTHRKNLLTKFEVNNTALLIKVAAKFGIVGGEWSMVNGQSSIVNGRFFPNPKSGCLNV